MSYKIAALISVFLGLVTCEPPPSDSYGAPLGPPLSHYPGNGGNLPFNNGNNNGGIYNDDGSNGAHVPSEPYEFGYQVKDENTGTNYDRKEQSDGNQVRGEYRVELPDGRTQIVTYYADWQTGFHADVKYEGEAQYPDQYNAYAGGYAQNYNGYNGYNGNGNAPGYNNNNGPVRSDFPANGASGGYQYNKPGYP